MEGWEGVSKGTPRSGSLVLPSAVLTGCTVGAACDQRLEKDHLHQIAPGCIYSSVRDSIVRSMLRSMKGSGTVDLAEHAHSSIPVHARVCASGSAVPLSIKTLSLCSRHLGVVNCTESCPRSCISELFTYVIAAENAIE